MGGNQKEFIEKKVLHAGTKYINFRDGTKVFFHFQTKQCNKEKTILDDSRKMGKGDPFHIILGKKFKLEVWEVILQKMALKEIALFTVDKSLVMQYPFVSKTFRDLHKPIEQRQNTHCCAMTLQSEGIGYEDLNSFLKEPTDLEFIMEIVDVQQPDDYEKETWQMNEQERIDLVPKLKQEGNIEYGKKNYKKASDLYAKAIGILEQLMNKEKPHDKEWIQLNNQKIPLLLNFAQCKLNEQDFYSVIQHCTEVLLHDKENVKAYFRRAKAHIEVWNPQEAIQDLEKVMELDPSLSSLAKKELTRLEEMRKQKDHSDKLKLKKLFA